MKENDIRYFSSLTKKQKHIMFIYIGSLFSVFSGGIFVPTDFKRTKVIKNSDGNYIPINIAVNVAYTHERVENYYNVIKLNK